MSESSGNTPSRGDVVWAFFGYREKDGGKVRPVVIVQNDAVASVEGAGAFRTLLAVPLTTGGKGPVNGAIRVERGSLAHRHMMLTSEASFVVPDWVGPIDLSRVDAEKSCDGAFAPRDMMAAIDARLAEVLGLAVRKQK